MTLKSLYEYFKLNPESMWIMRLENAVNLYNFIKENNIHKVLDLGTGIGFSAAVAAMAFHDKGETDWHIDSVEQYDKCIKIANKLIPEEFLKGISIHKSEPEAIQIEGILYQYFSVYKELPEQPEGGWDLICNDGPSPFLDGKKYIDLPNGTIHKLVSEGKLKPGVKVVYDGRKQSFNLLERYFSGNFLLISIPPRGQDFYALEVKDGELKVGDDLLDIIRNNTPYFKNHEEKDMLPLHEPSAQGKTTITPSGIK